jgi:hypothetical protein
MLFGVVGKLTLVVCGCDERAARDSKRTERGGREEREDVKDDLEASKSPRDDKPRFRRESQKQSAGEHTAAHQENACGKHFFFTSPPTTAPPKESAHTVRAKDACRPLRFSHWEERACFLSSLLVKKTDSFKNGRLPDEVVARKSNALEQAVLLTSVASAARHSAKRPTSATGTKKHHGLHTTTVGSLSASEQESSDHSSSQRRAVSATGRGRMGCGLRCDSSPLSVVRSRRW